MNKIFRFMLPMLLSCMVAGTQAQVIQNGEMAVVYYMPFTQVHIYVDYVQETYTAGPFCHFAEEFLGVDDYIEQDEVRYAIKNVDVRTHTVADTNRAYKVPFSAEAPMQLLTLNSKGILAGYNADIEHENKDKAQSKEKNNHKHSAGITPYTEDQIKANNLRQMAEATARQIYRIRENRMYILGGEIEKAPADGQAMRLVLEELDNQERQLVELFIGTKKTKKMTKTITYIPTKSEETILLHFSQSRGIVEADDVEGEPVKLNLQTHKQVVGAAAGVQDKKAPKASPIYYNLPGSCDIRVLYAGQTLAEKSYPVAQFGVSVALPMNLFTGKDLPHITFDTRTGNIRSITK